MISRCIVFASVEVGIWVAGDSLARGLGIVKGFIGRFWGRVLTGMGGMGFYRMFLLGLALEGVDEGLGKLDSFVGFLPERVVGVDAVVEADEDAFGFGDGNGGDKVAVAGDEDGFLDKVFGGKEYQVDAEEDVDLLLLEYRPAAPGTANIGQAAKSDGVAGQTLEGVKETAASGVAGLLLRSGRISLVRQGVVVVGAENIAIASQVCREFLIAEVSGGKFGFENFIQIATVDE